MTNEEQVAMLKRSVKEWNDYRKGRQDVANLSGVDLSGVDLFGANLFGANLRGTNLEEASLRAANLYTADLFGAVLTYVDLAGTDLQLANLSETEMIEADLTSTILTGANLRNANLRGAIFNKAHMGNADLTGANLDLDIEIVRLVGRATRSDDFEFLCFETNEGLIIKAGCRLMSPGDYRAHVAKEYPGTPKAKETMMIIKYLEDLAFA